MATIVEHRTTRGRYVVLGASYSMWKSARASRILGDLFPVEEEGTIKAVAVCDASGDLHYFSSDLLKVISVDGVDVNEILGAVDGSSTAAVQDS